MIRRVEAVYKNVIPQFRPGHATCVIGAVAMTQTNLVAGGEQRGYDPNAIAFVEVTTRAELREGKNLWQKVPHVLLLHFMLPFAGSTRTSLF